MLQYILVERVRASFKFCMGDKFMEQMEGGKKDNTFFSAL